MCIAYRDRQAILPQPNKKIQFYSLNHGSAMGSAYGLGIGARIASPESNVFIFTGDGCFRLYGGTLAEAAQLNLCLFIMKNEELALVQEGCSYIFNYENQADFHTKIASIEFCELAKVFGWLGFRVQEDLSNLEEILKIAYSDRKQSMIVEVSIDPKQICGRNFRYIASQPPPLSAISNKVFK